MEILWLIAIGVIAYLIGSVSSAIIVGRIFGGEDIRTKGSGNAGATKGSCRDSDCNVNFKYDWD